MAETHRVANMQNNEKDTAITAESVNATAHAAKALGHRSELLVACAIAN
jgi:hypothetical protein